MYQIKILNCDISGTNQATPFSFTWDNLLKAAYHNHLHKPLAPAPFTQQLPTTPLLLTYGNYKPYKAANNAGLTNESTVLN